LAMQFIARTLASARTPLSRRQRLGLLALLVVGTGLLLVRRMRLLEEFVRGGDKDKPLAYYHSHWTRHSAPLLDHLGASPKTSTDHVALQVLGQFIKQTQQFRAALEPYRHGAAPSLECSSTMNSMASRRPKVAA